MIDFLHHVIIIAYYLAVLQGSAFIHDRGGLIKEEVCVAAHNLPPTEGFCCFMRVDK